MFKFLRFHQSPHNYININICDFYSLSLNNFKRKFELKSYNSLSYKTKNGQNDYAKIQSFNQFIKQRKEEACRSIIVQVNSEKSSIDLYSYCQNFGDVKSMHHYDITGNKHFFVVEFSSTKQVNHLLRNASHYDEQIIPVNSHFLWFRLNGKKRKKNSVISEIPLVHHKKPLKLEINKIGQLFKKENNISEQIISLYEETKIHDLSLRLRFLTAHQIELAFSGLFPSMFIFPFGSSLNGYGNAYCDLDLCLHLENNSLEEKISNSRLIFQSRSSNANGRQQVQKYIEIFADLFSNFLPGCTNVRPITHARVPIIKYKQDYTALECDLSMTSLISVTMTELLYILNKIDERIQPLVFIIRSWARFMGLTDPNPGRWITNFSLTLMILFYLQNQAGILPSLKFLITIGDSEDKKFLKEGINSTFCRDISKIMKHFQPKKDLNLEELLIGFFNFYSVFEFDTKSISIISGQSERKADQSALFIVNPLEEHLNVSRNVSLEELERLKMEMRDAAWALESEKYQLISILQKNYRNKYKKVYNQIDVNELLNENSPIQQNKF